MENQASVWYVVLGSVLALTTSLLTEAYKRYAATKENKRSFKITLKLEAKSVLETIERLIEKYGQSQYFAIVILDELKEKLGRMDRLRDGIIFIKDDIKKEDALSLFNTLNLYHSDARILETIAFNQTPNNQQPNQVPPWNDENYRSQRQILAFRGTDLKREVQDLINFLER